MNLKSFHHLQRWQVDFDFLLGTLYTGESFKPRQPWGFNLSFENYLHLLFAPPATPALKEYPTGSER